MGFLAPLYILGLLGIGVPILLHLIKRTPQGRQLFSSLMFLTPSPPRLTRRSRLTNLLLLLMRALALAILALAFARPFFHWGDNREGSPSSGRRVIFLVDTSASMRRSDLWNDAKRQVETALADVKPTDEAGLYFFDRRLRPALTVAQWNEADPATRVALFRAKLAETSPGWSATRIGEMLAAAAENSGPSEHRIARQIVLISDLQQGGKLEALQGHEWPKEVAVRVLPVAARHAGNAGIQWVQAPNATSTEGGAPGNILQADGTLRVNVSNQADSTSEQFTLTWATVKGPVPGTAVQVYVAPGHSQVVKVPLPADGTSPDRLVLSGDDCDFDNTLYLVPPRTEMLKVAYVGDDAAADVNAMRYYLQSVLFDTPLRKVEVVARGAGQAVTAADLADARLAVVTRVPSDSDASRLREYAQGGGTVLWVGKDVAAVEGAGALVGRDLKATEASGDFALIGRVVGGHPLFAPFADARYGDFTKIHFWHHRTVKEAEDAGGWTVLAWFDGGDAYLLEQTLGKGVVRLMTSGWQPGDSQLALSSKFVPLMEEMVRRKDALVVGSQYAVGDVIAAPVEGGDVQVKGPDGKITQLSAGGRFSGADKPGIYHLLVGGAGGQDVALAVNLASEESRTMPVAAQELEQWGVKFTDLRTERALAEQERFLRNNELENRQKFWRWLLLGVLGLLAVETALAGRLSRGGTTKRAAV